MVTVLKDSQVVTLNFGKLWIMLNSSYNTLSLVWSTSLDCQWRENKLRRSM